MGSKKRLKATLRDMERRDALRLAELRDTDDALLRADERTRRLKELVLALAERCCGQSELLTYRAGRRAVIISETDQCPL